MPRQELQVLLLSPIFKPRTRPPCKEQPITVVCNQIRNLLHLPHAAHGLLQSNRVVTLTANQPYIKGQEKPRNSHHPCQIRPASDQWEGRLALSSRERCLQIRRRMTFSVYTSMKSLPRPIRRHPALTEAIHTARKGHRERAEEDWQPLPPPPPPPIRRELHRADRRLQVRVIPLMPMILSRSRPSRSGSHRSMEL